MTTKKSHARPRRGTTAVVTALLLVVLFSFTALGVDITWLVSVAHELQATADNCALAGARRVRQDPGWARDQAQSVGEANKAARRPVYLRRNDDNDDPEGDIVLGRYDKVANTFTATIYGNQGNDVSPNAIKVVARRAGAAGVDSVEGALPLLFGPVMGIKFADINRPAIAMVEGSSGTGIIVLCPDCKCAFRMSGTTLIDVGEAAIQVNSEHPDCPACGNGTPLLQAGELNISGSSFCDTPNVDVMADVNMDVDPVPDPLADLPPPSYDPVNDPDLTCTYAPGATLDPGYYSAGIYHSDGVLNLNPGIYVLDGRTTWADPPTVTFDDLAVGYTLTSLPTSEWSAGSVETYAYNPPGDPPPPTEYPLASSGVNSYAVGAGLTITFVPPVDTINFFFVHDTTYGFNVPPGNVEVIDVCGTTVFSAPSKQATSFNDSQNKVHITTGGSAPPMKSLVFTGGGVVDSVAYDPLNKSGLYISSQATFVAHGVMFYIAGGSVEVRAGAVVDITAIDSTQYAYPAGTSIYDGISFFQARDNPVPPEEYNGAIFLGNNETAIYGVMYFPTASIEIGGTPLALGSGIITYTLWIHGTADSWRELDPFTDPNLKVTLMR